MSTPRLVEDFYSRIWNQGDLASTSDLLSKQFCFRGSLGVELRGLDAFGEYVQSVRGALADYHCEILRLRNGTEPSVREDALLRYPCGSLPRLRAHGKDRSLARSLVIPLGRRSYWRVMGVGRPRWLGCSPSGEREGYLTILGELFYVGRNLVAPYAVAADAPVITGNPEVDGIG